MDFVEASITDLQTAQNERTISARALTEWYLTRIETLDKAGPNLNSVIELNPDALAIADQLDAERKTGSTRGPLHGIPILIKDNIDTADKMTTTAGSLALGGWQAKEDAFIVKKLREAGAIILGKTNLSEWANFRSTRSSSGWSSRGGQTKNPYALDRNPCGSSSGSGVAVAANLCAAAIGTETDGSIICPSSVNGIVGLKPTLGLLSRSGIIPISQSQDTAGPMTRTVADAALLLSALTGIDAKDPATRDSQKNTHRDYRQFLNAKGLEGARLGVVRNLMGYHEKVDAIVEQAIALMKAEGAELINLTINSESKLRDSEITVLLYEFKQGLNAYLSQLPASFPRSLAELIAFNDTNQSKLMPFFKQELLVRAQEKGALTEGEYRQALEQNHLLARAEGIDKALNDHQLDALIAPSSSPAWTTDLINGDKHLGGSSSLAAVAGYPNITVPAGFVLGLPVGLSFFSTAFQEGKLLSLAYAFEQASKVRKPPSFVPHAEM